jgi:hypothetical protein
MSASFTVLSSRDWCGGSRETGDGDGGGGSNNEEREVRDTSHFMTLQDCEKVLTDQHRQRII